ncbi:MAG: phosphate ABC transporter substrate-binding protein PstS [Cyanobium sp.]
MGFRSALLPRLRPASGAALASLALALAGCAGPGGGAKKLPTISGAGATFPAAAYQAWAAEYARSTGNRVNYQSVGSGAGVRQFLAGTVDFGATDEVLSAEEFQQGVAAQRGAVQIPMLGGTVTPAYNNPNCPALKLTQAQLTDVFLGRIRDWKELGCPARPITVVHRSDGSGTTKVFTASLSCFSEEWKSRVGSGKSVSWPVGVGGKGNEGVAGTLAQTPGSIGYVNQAYVRGPIRAAALQNRAGRFVTADAKSGAAGLNGVVLDEKLGGSDCNPAGADSFPIVAFTWILAYESGQGAGKAEAVRAFLTWALSEAPQRQASTLGFVPLQGEVLSKARAAIASIRD